MCVSLENAKEGTAYAEREQRFQERLARRDALKAVIREKYPEVLELLTEYYQEKHWY